MVASQSMGSKNPLLSHSNGRFKRACFLGRPAQKHSASLWTHHYLSDHAQSKQQPTKNYWIILINLRVLFNKDLDLFTSVKQVMWRIQILLLNPHVHLHCNQKKHLSCVGISKKAVSKYLYPFFMVWMSKNVPNWRCCWNLLTSHSTAPTQEQAKLQAAAAAFVDLSLLLLPPAAFWWEYSRW